MYAPSEPLTGFYDLKRPRVVHDTPYCSNFNRRRCWWILSKAFEKSKRMIISVWSEFLATCIRSSYTISCVPHDRRARKSCCSSQRRWFRLKWSITVLYTYRLVVWWLMFLPMFIHVGTMFLPWHSSDIWPWSRESLNIFVIHGAMDSALCFKINAGISSGPVQSLE